MEALGVMIQLIVDIMKIPFTVWDFTLSLWEIMLSLMVGSIVIYLIVGFFND